MTLWRLGAALLACLTCLPPLSATAAEPGFAPIAVTANRAGNDLVVTVADRGPGIPEEDLERVFDKFQRVTRPDGATGTGLGLAISRGIVEAHGGRISAQPRPGGGLEVQFTLPLEAEGGRDG